MEPWPRIRILMPTIIFIISLTVPVYASSTRRTPEVESALRWLKGQFEPSTALPQSYENPADAAAWTYDIATWTIVMTQADEIEFATTVIQTMLELQSDGAWVDGYSIINRTPITLAKSVGPNAWMGLALCHYFRATNENDALEAALRVADWLFGLQNIVPKQSRSDGAIPGGLDEFGARIQWISVEHNTDALALFYALNQITGEKKYGDAAQRIANWLMGQMWDRVDSHFEVGTVDLVGTINQTFPERLDTQTWTILGIDATKSLTGLAAKDFNGLPWIRQYQTTVQYQGKTVKGFGIKTFGPGSESFWSEGTAGYGLAAMTIGEIETATFYSDQIHRLQSQNGGIPHSVAPDAVPQSYPQKWDFNSVAAATWMIWLDSSINPFVVAEEKGKETHVLIVTGTVYEADGETVVAQKLSVKVLNANNKMMRADEAGRYAGEGQYIVTFMSVDSPVASRDDTLEVTITDSDGTQLVQEQHTLTPAEIQNRFVQVDVIVKASPPPWDVNADGLVNIFDLVLVGSQFGLSGLGLRVDVNRNGIVDVFDLVLVASHFGGSAVAAAPFREEGTSASGNIEDVIEPIHRAIDALAAIPDKPFGAEIALQSLRAWVTEADSISIETELLSNFPNPFNPETWMPYRLAFDAGVEITIYDLKGTLVRQLNLGYRRAGNYVDRERAAYWDGRDEVGKLVSSGVYFYQLRAGDFTSVNRMVLLK